jgi:hypothetical protein
MKIQLTENQDQIELLKAVGSKKRDVSIPAQEALAAFIGPVVAQVLDKMGFTSMIYRQFTFNEDEPATIPVHLYRGQGVNAVHVWYQDMAGGLGTSHVSGSEELTVATFPLDSAVSMLKKYARRSRLDVVSAALNRMAQELLVKKELNGFVILMKALAEATTNGADHIITSTAQNVLQPDDFNRLLTLNKRINTAFDGGTPTGLYTKGVTDVLLSPEMIEQLRSLSYNPVNTRQAGSGTTSIPLPDSIRESIYRASGVPEMFGKTLWEMVELGVGQAYNSLFAEFAVGNIAHGSQAFDASDDEIVIGLDLTNDGFISPVGKDESGETVTAAADDQWFTRSEKFGWYSHQTLGFVTLDARNMAAIVV